MVMDKLLYLEYIPSIPIPDGFTIFSTTFPKSSTSFLVFCNYSLIKKIASLNF